MTGGIGGWLDGTTGLFIGAAVFAALMGLAQYLHGRDGGTDAGTEQQASGEGQSLAAPQFAQFLQAIDASHRQSVEGLKTHVAEFAAQLGELQTAIVHPPRPSGEVSALIHGIVANLAAMPRGTARTFIDEVMTLPRVVDVLPALPRQLVFDLMPILLDPPDSLAKLEDLDGVEASYCLAVRFAHGKVHRYCLGQQDDVFMAIDRWKIGRASLAAIYESEFVTSTVAAPVS